MRGIIAIALLGACTFTPGTPADPGSGGGGGGGGGGGAAPDAPAIVNRPPCDLTDPSVQLCLDFEATDLGIDSGPGHHDATVTSVTSMVRSTTDHAAMLDMSSSIRVGETSALDIPDKITYEAWIAPTQYPPMGSRAIAIDNTGQYRVSLQPDGKARCEIGTAHVDSLNPIQLGTTTWTHIACVYDQQSLDVYVNGDQSQCAPYNAPISTTGTSGTSIGVSFMGAIDNVHVLSRDATSDDVCMHAGRTNCQHFCGGDDHGGGLHF
jgi:hypothetical protein